MKKFILLILCFFVIGCGNYPDFYREAKVINKVTYGDNVSIYTFDTHSTFFNYSGKLRAPYEFANVGDIVYYENGVIKSRNPNKKEVKNGNSNGGNIERP